MRSKDKRISEFTYDLDGRLEQVNSPEGVINYGYDIATGRHNRTCTANSEAEYGYDEMGRLETVHVVRRNIQSVDVQLRNDYHHVGIEGGNPKLSPRIVIIDTANVAEGRRMQLIANLVGELEHVPSPDGLGMDEPDAEIHFHEVFLPAMGWQNTELTNMHHHGQHYTPRTP